MRPAKRAFDLIFAVPGLIVCLPVLLIVAIVVRLTSRGPVFFKQLRIGQGGKPFTLYKFRSMVTDAPKGSAITIGVDPRITKIGHIIRKTKVDELPQLWNVVKGDMSLVGPRPESETYVKDYTEDQRRILDVVPGITDPASMKYRNESELLGKAQDPHWTYVHEILPDKLEISLRYAERSTIWTDLQVIFNTVMGRDRR